MRREDAPITVEQLTNYLKQKMDYDPHLQNVRVKGELSNVSAPNYSGHRYFAIKDKKAVIKCVMFRGDASKLGFELKNGANVIVEGQATIYPSGGYHQIIANHLEEENTTGDLFKQMMIIKERLEAKGYLDQKRKKQIPAEVSKVAIITSLTSAVVQDMKTTITRRNKFIQIDCYNALMQGDMAAKEVMERLKEVDAKGYDVIIIGRGGGSMEDLWAFNDEKLAEMVVYASTPIISAIGHETDYTILDFVADFRASTPTQAGETVSSITMRDYEAVLKQLTDKAEQVILNKLERAKMALKINKLETEKNNPQSKQQENRKELERLIQEANWIIQKKLERSQQAYNQVIEKAGLLNPFTIMKRGYAVVYKEAEVVKGIDQVKEQDQITVKVVDGDLICLVQEKKHNEPKKEKM